MERATQARKPEPEAEPGSETLGRHYYTPLRVALAVGDATPHENLTQRPGETRVRMASPSVQPQLSRVSTDKAQRSMHKGLRMALWECAGVVGGSVGSTRSENRAHVRTLYSYTFEAPVACAGAGNGSCADHAVALAPILQHYVQRRARAGHMARQARLRTFDGMADFLDGYGLLMAVDF